MPTDYRFGRENSRLFKHSAADDIRQVQAHALGVIVLAHDLEQQVIGVLDDNRCDPVCWLFGVGLGQ
ncbi:MAG TPA: hypothetical protein ENN81_01395 [Phycisphaerales bacterium]|nr:hypothetical protein [Phycisphaerales bacterium]